MRRCAIKGDDPSSATTLRYYRSTDATITSDDEEVGTDAIGALNSSAINGVLISLTAPTSAGTYYYGACVESVSGESDTDNNCSQAVTVTVSSEGATADGSTASEDQDVSDTAGRETGEGGLAQQNDPYIEWVWEDYDWKKDWDADHFSAEMTKRSGGDCFAHTFPGQEFKVGESIEQYEENGFLIFKMSRHLYNCYTGSDADTREIWDTNFWDTFKNDGFVAGSVYFIKKLSDLVVGKKKLVTRNNSENPEGPFAGRRRGFHC